MSEIILINGKRVAREQAVVSVFDRGFLYGDSVFEVLRTYQGRPFAEREHFERLHRSCERMLIPWRWSLDDLSREVAAALGEATHGESYIRVVITRGEGPLLLDLRTASAPNRVLIVAPLPEQPASMYEEGVAVSLVRTARATDDNRARGAKVSNYVPNLLALETAKSKGSYEAVFLGTSGEVSEGASTNIFAVRAGVVLTPPAETGLLEGVTRSHLLLTARAAGIEVRQGVLWPSDLYQADEVFLTSTLREVVPVVAVDDVRVGSGKPGPTTLKLLELFRQRAKAATGGT